MLSGRRAFDGDDTTETLAAVVRDTPKYNALPAGTPVRLRQLLERCLQRDVRMRLRDIGDARIELVEVTGTSSGDGPVPAMAPSRAVWLVVGVVAGAAVTALALLMGAPPSAPSASARARFQLTLPDAVQLPPDSRGGISVSPDGRFIVFAAVSGEWRLWLRPIDADEAKPLPGTEGGTLPFWSPDSAFLGFFAGQKLKRLEINTGTIQTLCDSTGAPGGGTWNREGVIVFSPRVEGPLFRVAATGGTPRQLTTLDAANHESNHVWPWFLPDGRRYLYQANAGIYAGTLDFSGTHSADSSGIAGPHGGAVHTFRSSRLCAKPSTRRAAVRCQCAQADR